MHIRKLFSVLMMAALVFVGAGCGGGSQSVTLSPITLSYWRYDTPDKALDGVIEKYREQHPNISILVKTFSEKELEQELLEAFAEDKGPDMFSVPNVWLRKWETQLAPMPGETAVATPVLTDGKRSVVLKKTQSPTLRDISNLYVDAAVKDMLFTIPATEDTPEATAVMGVPFSLDTLGLFSNMDLLTSAGIKEPPKTWQEFELAVTKLTARRGDVVALAGAAMGTSRNVPHATEILGTLMQQNGTTMTDARGFAQFQERERSTGGFPAIDALLFYQNFANPAAGTYTWNANMPNGFDAFVTGSAAMYFGYPTDAVVARERNGKLRFVITGMPQVNLGRSLSTALYPIEVVSKKSVHQQEAWDFLLFAASGEQVSSYLSSASRPPALRALIPAAAGNPEVAGFANQVLTATSWYRGNDYSEVEAAFEEMMESDVEARDLGDLMEAAVRRINVTIQ